jgi:Primase X
LNSSLDEHVEAGLDFILGHFTAFPFPRAISTKTTEGRQVWVNNRAEALARFKQANYLDCRINAYSNHDIRGNPNFIFIDLDSTDKILVDDILARRIQSIEAHPTVLFTGSGYHIYQPIECRSICLDEYATLADCSTEPSRQFLKFAEMYISNNKSDPNHNPSFKSCMVRIPNSVNSKNGSDVKIVQSWNGQRPDISLLLGSFYAWLLTEQKKQQDRASAFANRTSTGFQNQIKWIENSLLKTALNDYRKTITKLVLAPYLVNIRQLPFEQSSNIIENWLNICKTRRELDFNPKLLVNAALSNARKSGYKPMSLSTLKQRNSTVYQMLRG